MDENFRSHRLFRIGRYDCRKRCEVLDLGGHRTYQFYTGGSENLTDHGETKFGITIRHQFENSG